MKKIVFKSKKNTYNKNDIVGLANPAEFKNIDITKIKMYTLDEPSIRYAVGINWLTKLTLFYQLGL